MTNKYKYIQKFREKFVIDPSEVFFGKKEDLEKAGWTVGNSQLIIKQDVLPAEFESFLTEAIKEVERETAKNIKINIQKLHQWLNENRITESRLMVTSEQLEMWLGVEESQKEDK